MQANILDLYHDDEVTDWTAVAGAGIWGVIHKASQGASVRDSAYAVRRADALAAGLLWGAYHFGTADDVGDQVTLFLDQAKPDERTLLALDLEPNGRGRTMSIEQARQFVTLIKEKTGRFPVLYGGSLLKDKLDGPDDVLRQCPLWLSQYGTRAVCPPGWSSPWLWQFTGDGEGPGPHAIPGVKRPGIDLSTYAGTRDQLAAEWSGAPALQPATAAPSISTLPKSAPSTNVPSKAQVAAQSWSVRSALVALAAWVASTFSDVAHWLGELLNVLLMALPDAAGAGASATAAFASLGGVIKQDIGYIVGAVGIAATVNFMIRHIDFKHATLKKEASNG